MPNLRRYNNIVKIILAFLVSPWISGLVYYSCTWSAPIIEGRIESYLTYLKKYQIYPLEQIFHFAILHYFPFILFGLPILLICNKFKKNDFQTYLMIWVIVGIGIGLTFSGLFWSPDDKGSFNETYWILYSVPISMAFGGAAFWFIGIKRRINDP